MFSMFGLEVSWSLAVFKMCKLLSGHIFYDDVRSWNFIQLALNCLFRIVHHLPSNYFEIVTI